MTQQQAAVFLYHLKRQVGATTQVQIPFLPIVFGVRFCEDKVLGTYEGEEGEHLETRHLSRGPNVTLTEVQAG